MQGGFGLRLRVPQPPASQRNVAESKEILDTSTISVAEAECKVAEALEAPASQRNVAESQEILKEAESNVAEAESRRLRQDSGSQGTIPVAEALEAPILCRN